MPRKKTNKTTVAITFAVVFGILGGGTVLVLVTSGPIVEHFPSNITIPAQPWMNFIPENAIEAGVVNLTAARDSGINTLQFPFLRLTQVGMNLGITNSSLLATYYLPAPPSQPNSNSSEIIIFQPTTEAYIKLYRALNSTNLLANTTYRSFKIFTVYNNITGVSQLQQGMMSFYQGYVFFVQRSPNLLGDMQVALNQVIDKAPGLFQNMTAVRAVYAALQGRTNYISLQFVGFPVQISGTLGGSKVIYANGGSYMGNYAIGFYSLSSAKSSFNFVESVYHGGYKYFIMDNYVVAQMSYNSTSVLNQITTF